MTDALSLVEAAETRLRPLEEARNRAWWDANVQAGDDTERRRAETEMAYSNALADGALFAEIVGARGSDGHDPMVARCLDLLHDLMLRHQLPDSLRAHRSWSMIERTEMETIRRALQDAGGNRSKAAELLGVSRATIHRKLKTYNL